MELISYILIGVYVFIANSYMIASSKIFYQQTIMVLFGWLYFPFFIGAKIIAWWLQ